MNKKIVHIYNWWNADNKSLKRMNNAKITWDEFYSNDKEGIVSAKFSLKNGQRSSVDLGEKAIAPFILDVIDYGLLTHPECNYFLYTNTDISLVSDSSIYIRDCLNKWECGYSHRIDFSEDVIPKNPITRDQLKNLLHIGSWSAGSDIFFFSKKWWNKHRHNLPDALIGFEAWDACFMVEMLKSGLPEPVRWISYHQKHESYWKKYRLTSRGQLYNREVCKKWAIKNKIGHLINYGDFLFKLPTPYNIS
ncbi:MAG: hypothetical protein JXA91_04070 [Candidatus Thermoplasmatota archaeon]|nr:hypothetical protein [Candidatus Thermoplasmatota archaeon]